jgi:hypothetical protein
MRKTPFRSTILVLVLGLALGKLAVAFEPRPPQPTTVVPANQRAKITPVRLPPIDLVALQPDAAGGPFFFAPITSLVLEDIQTAPAVTLGVGQPSGEKPSIGGWISFGGAGRGFNQ